jgi:hypothetical protein
MSPAIIALGQTRTSVRYILDCQNCIHRMALIAHRSHLLAQSGDLGVKSAQALQIKIIDALKIDDLRVQIFDFLVTFTDFA